MLGFTNRSVEFNINLIHKILVVKIFRSTYSEFLKLKSLALRL